MSVEYNSLSKWKVAHNTLQAQDSYLNIIKFIFLRESSLIKISDLVLQMDKIYWRYANTYIARKLYFKNNLKCDELKQMHLQIAEKQELLSVAIAHLRSISVDIVESVHQWRKHLQNDVTMRDTASLYWNGQNYLIKMLHDTQKLFNTQTMLMWMGFEVDCFIIPPRQFNPHTERLNRERKALKLKQKREDHQTAALKKLMSQQVRYKSAAIIDRDAVRRQTAALNANPVARRGRMSTSDDDRPSSSQTAIVSSSSTPTLPPIGATAPTLVNKADHTQSVAALKTATASDDDDSEKDDGSQSGDDEDETSMGSSSVTSILTEDSGSGWRELRDSCLPSWRYYHNQTDDSEDVNVFEIEEDFWENIDHSEHLVEAATGYLDLYPKKYIVPPIKKSLITRCKLCEQVLLDEVSLAEQVKERMAVCKELKVELNKEKLQEKLDELNTEEKQVQLVEEMRKIRSRQESMKLRDHVGHNEISREYVARLLDERKPYQRYISSARTTTRSPSPSRSSPTRTSRLNSPVPRSKNNNMFAVFLTAPSMIETDFTMSTQSFIPENVKLKIDPDVLKERIKSVVDNDRQACIRVGSSLVVRTSGNRNNRSRAYQNKPTRKRNALEAIVFMQALIRGVVTRNRLSRKNKIQSRMAATLFIQKCLRNYIHRCRARVKRRLFKADCLRVRRHILISHRSADVIKTFFRYIVFMKKRVYFLNKYAAIAKLNVPRMAKVLKSAVKIQSLLRGFSTRVWFSNVLIESRKRLIKVGKIGPKYKNRIILASRRQHHFSIAGSGGFRFWWKHDPKKNSVEMGNEVVEQSFNASEETVCSIFMTNVTNRMTTDEPARKPNPRPLEIKHRTVSMDDVMDTGRRSSVGAVSEESASLDELSLSQPASSGVALARSTELKKRSHIRGKIAMLKGGSRSHCKGVNLLRAVPVKEREFVQHRITGAPNSVSGSSLSSMDGSIAGTRSHTYAYENPNVHFKAKQARMGGLSSSLYSSSLNSARSNELNGMLKDVYGFQK